MNFGVVPVPNLCVELRGYDPAAAEEASASVPASTSGPPHPGNVNGDGNSVATAYVTAGHSWHGWGEGKPRFMELQRTGESDGSFVFVTPESGMVLVLAAYPHRGENPYIVRVFPDDSRKGYASKDGTGRGASGGEASAFGSDSGRVMMHMDLSEGTHLAPEVLWSASAAAQGKDQSPCARHEAAVEASGRLGAARGGDAAAGGEGASARQRGRWPLGGYDVGGGAGEGKVDQAKKAVTALLCSSTRYIVELGASCWEASAAVWASLRWGLDAAGQRVHQSALAASVSASEWFETVEVSSWLASKLFSPTTMLFNRLWQGLASTHFSAWFGEASASASAPVVSWLKLQLERGPVDLRSWCLVWWVRVGVIALVLGLLQEAFFFVYKYFHPAAAAVEVAVDGRQCSGSLSPRRHDQDSAGTSSTLVGTFYSSDGKVCQLDFGKLGRGQGEEEEPATAERKRRGVFGAAWGGISGNSNNSNSGRSKLADKVGGGRQEKDHDEANTDQFSSMFRALSQTSCSVTGFADEDEVDGDGASSNVVVVTQPRW